MPPAVVDSLSSLMRRETWLHSSVPQASMVGDLASRTALLPDPARHAHFAVLRAPDIPSVLIELGFLSNPGDERQLRRAEHRAGLARAIVEAIDAYFRTVRGQRAVRG